MARGDERPLDFGEEANAFFRSDAADKAEAERVVVHRAKTRVELLTIHAAGHEEGALLRVFFQPVDLFRRGSERNARNPVEAQDKTQRVLLCPIVSCARGGTRQKREKLFEAATGVLVKVSVPGGDQR